MKNTKETQDGGDINVPAVTPLRIPTEAQIKALVAMLRDEDEMAARQAQADKGRTANKDEVPSLKDQPRRPKASRTSGSRDYENCG